MRNRTIASRCQLIKGVFNHLNRSAIVSSRLGIERETVDSNIRCARVPWNQIKVVGLKSRQIENSVLVTCSPQLRPDNCTGFSREYKALRHKAAGSECGGTSASPRGETQAGMITGG
ncbi:MAG: hypothetical protein ABS79_05435 [Planctomycetes bacterium SCN 63-9]|nr:MAG: hypothetical protein ABS79_05435 [Planctomycetes bacterium SCN 63-9]